MAGWTFQPSENQRIAVLCLHTAQRAPLGADMWVHARIIEHLDRDAFDVHVALAGTPSDPTPTSREIRGLADTTIVSVDFGTEDADWEPQHSLKSLASSVWAPWHLARLARHIRRHDIRVIATSDRPRDAVAAILLGRATGARVVIHVHTEYASWMSAPLRWALSGADLLVAVSDYVASTLRAGGLARVQTVLNAIDVDRWRPGVGREATRRALGIDAAAPVVLTVCRLFPGKGLAEVIAACGALAETHPDLELLVAGLDVTPSQTYLGELRELAKSVGAPVRFLGRRDDIPALMAAADIFAMPAHAEPFGLVYAEAMAMGLPVVSVATGGTVEVVDDGVTGLLSARDNSAALTSNLERLINDPGLRHTFGAAGRERVERYFRLDRQACEVGAIYRDLVTGEGRNAARPAHIEGAIMDAMLDDSPAPTDVERCRRLLDEQGFVVFRGIARPEPLTALGDTLSAEYSRAVAAGEMFKGGGSYTGHLNCYPGEHARFIWDDLERAGIPDLVRAVRPDIADQVRVTLNFNLPGSVAQHYHADGLYVEEFLICNVAVVDTDLDNGAIDVLPGTNRRFYKFWDYAVHRTYRSSTRVPLRTGDVIVRTSTTWHRGMPNRTAQPRPMLAVTFGETAAPDGDPFAEHQGAMRFYPNWYSTSPLSQLRERLFVKAPLTYSAYRFTRSLRGNRGYASW